MDACNDAKSKGADVVKQWDSTLDGITRPSHRVVDGEIRELDKAFSNGLMFPGDPSGKAAEVVNCRCALLQRARWELDEDELETLKERAEFFGLDKTENFEDFKKKYLDAAEKLSDSDNIKKADKELREFKDHVNSDEERTVLNQDYVREKVYDTAPPYSEKKLDKYSNSGIIESENKKHEIPKEVVNDINKAVDKVAEDFPVIRKQVEPIEFADISSALGENGLLNDRAVNVIRLSKDYCSDYDKLRKKLADDFESHFSYEADNVGSLTCHELGHAIHKILAMKRAGIKYGEALTPIKKVLFEQELRKIRGEIYLAAFSDETLEEIDETCISGLGTMTYRNPDELIAQSFGNYYYGKSKSRVGKAIFEYFKKGLA